MIHELDTPAGKVRVGNGEVWSDMHETCPVCGDMECFFSCAESRNSLSLDSVVNRQRWNAFVDGIESLVLAMSEAGYDVRDEAFRKALDTAVDAGANNFADC